MRYLVRKMWVLCTLCFLLSSGFSQENVKCLIKTSLGEIVVELYYDKAPITVRNFLKYVNLELYYQTSFYRVCNPENESEREIKIEVIQGGNVADKNLSEPIPLETTQKTGLKHENGTISMARGGPNTAQSSFFICIHDQPELDFGGKRNPDGQGFAAFGKVIKGMEVVHLIQKQEDKGQFLIEPVNIYSITQIILYDQLMK
ncbi:MAG: peptidylprolyl isomerase [Bacteroidales bacterium]|nr:peptidylprolyl isomerase [Bacteroidales bacterium]